LRENNYHNGSLHFTGSKGYVIVKRKETDWIRIDKERIEIVDGRI